MSSALFSIAIRNVHAVQHRPSSLTPPHPHALSPAGLSSPTRPRVADTTHDCYSENPQQSQKLDKLLQILNKLSPTSAAMAITRPLAFEIVVVVPAQHRCDDADAGDLMIEMVFTLCTTCCAQLEARHPTCTAHICSAHCAPSDAVVNSKCRPVKPLALHTCANPRARMSLDVECCNHSMAGTAGSR